MDHFKSGFDTCGNRLEETCKRKLHIFDDFKTKINKLNLDFDTKHQSLTGQIEKLTSITEELESMHKNTTVGRLKGATIGAAGGITSIVGLALAPLTLGASLGLTVVGGVVGAAGGVLSRKYNSKNNTQQKHLRENIEKITSDFQNTINAMLEILNTIINSTEEIQQLVQQDMNYYIPARMIQGGVERRLGLPKAEMPQKSEAAKQFDKAGCYTKEAVTTFRSCSDAVRKIYFTAEVAKTMGLSSENVKIVIESAQTAKAFHLAAAVSGVISALLVVVDVYCIVKNSKEISEMNQSADKRNAKNIKSDALKFIHQMRETTAHFQKTLNEIKDARDTAIKEFNRELKNCTSFLVRQKHRANYNAQIRVQAPKVRRHLLYPLAFFFFFFFFLFCFFCHCVYGSP